MSRFAFRNRPRKLSKGMGHDSGPPGRERRLQKTISMLLRFQRIEGSWGVINETREYTEALIERAIKKGPEDPRMMALANHWCLEKDLVHMLFKEYVPRFSQPMYQNKPYLQLYRIELQPGKQYLQKMACLELKGNPWPKVKPEPPNTAGQLHNVLLKAFFDDKRKSSHLRPHASAQPSLDDVVEGVEKLSVNNQKLPKEKTDRDTASIENDKDFKSSSGDTDLKIGEILTEDKKDSNPSNAENKM
ncbi:uncharacterized protein LOC133196364 [Saccostrea echinata]|uniref:uncharacterized protein LOC133196364 n=1 Tax=Saccostrea echinata TaxID=191078 RepID=UPI002A803AD3|nr:uncharacterized protein LOC133196364 [Saccostrea echinata]